MNKAYDRIEYYFFREVMARMGFNQWWIQMVMDYVTTVGFSVLLNGQLGETFKPSQGLRQSNSLSPYLFLIVSEVLSRLLQRAADRGLLQDIKMSNNGPHLSHLMFVNNTLIFLQVNS